MLMDIIKAYMLAAKHIDDKLIDYQLKDDLALETTVKNMVGAINELNSEKAPVQHTHNVSNIIGLQSAVSDLIDDLDDDKQYVHQLYIQDGHIGITFTEAVES